MAGDAMRLQKFLSRAGIASRRAGEALIRSGRVRVNGVEVRELGTQVDADRDVVEVDGRPVELAPPVWIALHKPAGYVTTRRDPQRRPTVYELLPARFRGLFHVGRLDVDSEGLLLLTNQGDVAHRLLHPRGGVARLYEADVQGTVAERDLARLRSGVALEDGLARAESVERRRAAGPGLTRVRLTLREGRKREVRRMLDAIGHPVERLVRLWFGPIRLGRLPAGRWRRLSTSEVGALEAACRPAPEG